MPLHLIKLCVGVDHPDQLSADGRQSRGREPEPIVHTRQTPKRAAEIVEGGSLYWVMRGQVLCRQAVLAIDTTGEGAASRCTVRLAPEVVLTSPAPRRAFQGWRYLAHEAAPADLGLEPGQELPAALAQALRSLGAW